MSPNAKPIKPISIAMRLAIGLTIGMAILWLGAAIIASLVMQSEMNEALDETMQKNAQLLLPLANLANAENRSLATDSEAFEEMWGDAPFILLSASGELLFASHTSKMTKALHVAPLGFSNKSQWRILNYIDPATGNNIILTQDSHERDELLEESLIALILPLLALIPLIAIGIWYGVKLSLAPVDRLRKDIAKRGGHNLTSLNSQSHPKEFAPIAKEVENLMARLEAALQAERSFAASSAHELRTPLAGALAQTQLLMQEIDDKDALKRLTEVERSLKHLSELSEKLLQLSRLEAGFAKTERLIDLLPIVNMVIDEFKFDHQKYKRIKLKVSPNSGLVAAIHADAFFLALRNLLQNAFIHGSNNGDIDIIIDEHNRIHVQNSGKVIAANVMNKIGKPFIRGATDAAGSGLGLSIVCSIMEQTAGKIIFNSPISDKDNGFEVILSW